MSAPGRRRRLRSDGARAAAAALATVPGMKKLYFAALSYMILGLIAGLYYRELTKEYDFTGDSQLSVVHTHLLTLGMLAFLLVLALEKLFALTKTKQFNWFFWIYNAGLVVTVGMMVTHGSMTVVGNESGDAIAGIAGMGHVLLTIALVLLFVSLYQALFSNRVGTGKDDEPVPAAADRE